MPKCFFLKTTSTRLEIPDAKEPIPGLHISEIANLTEASLLKCHEDRLDTAQEILDIAKVLTDQDRAKIIGGHVKITEARKLNEFYNSVAS